MLAVIAVPTIAPQDAPLHSMLKRITVEELGQVLAAAHDKPDQEVAQQLSGLELTERLSTVRFSHWEIQSPGPKSPQALMALADVSAFLDLPAAAIPAIAAPGLAAQRRMMALTVDYATKTIHQLPNFSATRVTTSFRDEPEIYERPKMEWFPFYRPLPANLRCVPSANMAPLYFIARGGKRCIPMRPNPNEVVHRDSLPLESLAPFLARRCWMPPRAH